MREITKYVSYSGKSFDSVEEALQEDLEFVIKKHAEKPQNGLGYKHLIPLLSDIERREVFLKEFDKINKEYCFDA